MNSMESQARLCGTLWNALEPRSNFAGFPNRWVWGPFSGPWAPHPTITGIRSGRCSGMVVRPHPKAQQAKQQGFEVFRAHTCPAKLRSQSRKTQVIHKEQLVLNAANKPIVGRNLSPMIPCAYSCFGGVWRSICPQSCAAGL